MHTNLHVFVHLLLDNSIWKNKIAKQIGGSEKLHPTMRFFLPETQKKKKTIQYSKENVFRKFSGKHFK